MSVGAGEKRPRWGAEERRGREGKERRRKEKRERETKKRGREERESRECKDRGNKRSTERHQGKKEKETGQTQISFSVCGSRRGRTGAATTKKGRPRHTLAIKEARRSERAQEQRLLRG